MYKTFTFLNASGIACPLSSLSYEKDFGIGDLKGAYKFVDFLAESGFCAWKMLPIHELVEENNFSPYDPISAFAIDSLYIDITSLKDIDYSEIADYLYLNRLKFHQQNDTHFSDIRKFKNEILRKAFEEFYINEYGFNSNRFKEFQDFINENHEWILDYGLYRAISDELRNIPLKKWPNNLKQKDKKTITAYRKKLEKDIFYYQYVQWLCLQQWQKFKEYANKKGVFLIGDVSFYVGAMSVDVWANPQYFEVDKNLAPTSFGGVPADLFNPTGQLWQVAVYNWEALKDDGYIWWLHRLNHLANLFDSLRLDHFRGFIQYWKIADKSKPELGKWVDGPGTLFINTIVKYLQDKRLCSIYVENLGFITQEVEVEREKMGLKGSLLYSLSFRQIHQKEFSLCNMIESTNHDLHPLKKWWREISREDKEFIINGLGLELVQNDLYEMTDSLRMRILEFLADQKLPLTLFAIQDILGIEETINTPGTTFDNWTFRLPKNVEGLIQNKPLIAQLVNLSKRTNTNRYTKLEKAKTLPEVNGKVIRFYKINEPVVFWCFSKYKEDKVVVVSNITSDKSIGEVSMKCVQVTNLGSLFFVSLQPVAAGTYFLTVRVNDIYLSEFEKDLQIIVED